MSVYKKLMQARIKLASMSLTKSGENKFAGYKYFELADFLPQTMVIFSELELASYISFNSELATLTIVDLEDMSTVVITSPMAEANLKGAHPIQNLGAVESYQRRYLWMAALELVENDVIDASAPAEVVQRPTPKPSVPKNVTASEGKWNITIKATENASQEDWLEIVKDSCKTCLSLAQNEEDVMQIFRRNKQLFDKVKQMDAVFFKGLMDLFGTRKNELKESK